MTEPVYIARCDQCGREGSRGFETIPADHEGPTDGITSFTVCANHRACEKRRPKWEPDDV